MCLWCDQDDVETVEIDHPSGGVVEIRVCGAHYSNLKQHDGHGSCANCAQIPDHTVPERNVISGDVGSLGFCLEHWEPVGKTLEESIRV